MNRKPFVILLYFLVAISFFSCMPVVDQSDCKEINKIEVFSLGYPDITFAFGRMEKEVRKNQNRLIINDVDLEKIRKLLDGLHCIEKDEKWTGDIMVVCDFYCKEGKKFTLLYDSFTVKINDSFYCDGEDLIKQIMENAME